MIGIYCIFNTVSGKRYVGSSSNLERRERTHFHYLNRVIHSNKHLQDSFNKYGANSFEFIILEVLDTEENIHFQENFWIAQFNCIGNGYNSCWAGLSSTELSRKKIQLSNKGRKRSEETISRMRIAQKGHPVSLEQREKIRKTLSGKPGNPHTEETKVRIGLAQKGKILSEETKEKIRQSLKRTRLSNKSK